MREKLIRNISDTALWVAAFRALETERSDALFRDPLAARLAGARITSLAGKFSLWGGSRVVVLRTLLIDRIIDAAIKEGCDAVLNLAAGLDSRPYRMSLPSELRWYEVDLPDLISYKESLLVDETPVCHLRRIPLDLANRPLRATLFSQVNKEARRVLVLTEGLLVYLTPHQVRELGEDLYSYPQFQHWVFDLMSVPLAWLNTPWRRQFEAAQIQLKFSPPEGTEFFRPLGWQETEYHSVIEAGERFNRDFPGGKLIRQALGKFSPATLQRCKQAYAIAAMERIS